MWADTSIVLISERDYCCTSQLLPIAVEFVSRFVQFNFIETENHSMQCNRPQYFAALSFLSFLIFIPSLHAQIAIPLSGDVNTIAGTGVAGYSGDTGAATSAKLNNPSAVAVDSSGNVYIADATNNVIRKITASTGIITTIAGTGTAGFSGDGGSATSAELDDPQSVAVDTLGNIFIADTANNRIRQVSASTGDISTVAGDGTQGYYGDGSAATSAELNQPAGVAVDAAENIYIADTSNQRIREVTASTGNIATIVGNGTAGNSGDGGAATSAELNYPHGIAAKGSGSTVGIYIADTDNNRVRVFLAITGDIQPIAGSGTQGYSGDGGTATNAEMNLPTGVAFDPSQNIYIADSGNNRIREVNAQTSVISSIAGNGTAGYSGDGGAATGAELNNPSGITIDAFSNIYIADQSNNSIRMVGENTPVYASCSPNPAPWGNGTECTASIGGVDPTGTVEWEVNSTAWQTDTLSGSTDSISGLSGDGAGTYTITAIYSGDSSQPSGSGSTSFVISQPSTGDSYVGAWLPPTIYQSNTWYSKTAAFSGPSNAKLTTIQWQLQWTPNDVPPSGLQMKICNASSVCTTISNPSEDGNTSFFGGESVTQTFTFEFEIPTSRTVTYNPAYTGISTNSWIEANYDY